MSRHKNKETVLYHCAYCGNFIYVNISPKDRKWICQCGASYIIAPKSSAKDILVKLQKRTGRGVMETKNSFSLHSPKGNLMCVSEMVLLIVTSGQGEENGGNN